jgi:hypothetical protein
MRKYDDFLAEQLQDEEFKKEYNNFLMNSGFSMTSFEETLHSPAKAGMLHYGTSITGQE